MEEDLILAKAEEKSENKYWPDKYISKDMKYLRGGHLSLLTLLIE